MRIGLLYMGNEADEIWGSAITTLYLAAALETRGHQVWRASATTTTSWQAYTSSQNDLVISEGVPSEKIPLEVWETTKKIILWCLSSLFFGPEELFQTRFHGVASNSVTLAVDLSAIGLRSKFIELAASEALAQMVSSRDYECDCTFVGTYPHKTAEQMRLLFKPASAYRFSIWGYGWEDSVYAGWHRGALPLRDIGRLYKSATIVLALTENRQKSLLMINNRIFEALACGAVVVSDPHSGIQEHEIGQYIHFVKTEEEASAFIDQVLNDADFRAAQQTRARAGQELVLRSHTYRQRAELFELFYSELCSEPDIGSKPNSSIRLIHDSSMPSGWRGHTGHSGSGINHND